MKERQEMQHKDNYKRQAGLLLPIITQLCCATTLLFVSFNSHADIRGRVVRILDGDTLEVLQQNGELTRVRLNGIDAPEKAQPFGQRSRQALTEMTAGKVVHIAGNNRDRYDRLLGTVWYDIKRYQCRTGSYRYGLGLPVQGQGGYTGLRRSGGNSP